MKRFQNFIAGTWREPDGSQYFENRVGYAKQMLSWSCTAGEVR